MKTTLQLLVDSLKGGDGGVATAVSVMIASSNITEKYHAQMKQHQNGRCGI